MPQEILQPLLRGQDTEQLDLVYWKDVSNSDTTLRRKRMRLRTGNPPVRDHVQRSCCGSTSSYEGVQ